MKRPWHSRRINVTWSLLLLAATAAAPALPQDYPARPLRLVTGAADGSNDFVTRIIAQGLSTTIGRPAVVDNRASGVLEGETVARATPEEFTALMKRDRARWEKVIRTAGIRGDT